MAGNGKNFQVAHHKANLQSKLWPQTTICALLVREAPAPSIHSCLLPLYSLHFRSPPPLPRNKTVQEPTDKLYLSNAHTVRKDRASDLEGVGPRFPLSSLLTPQTLLSRPTQHTLFILLTTPPWSPAPNSTPGILCSLILNSWYHFLTLVCAPKPTCAQLDP